MKKWLWLTFIILFLILIGVSIYTYQIVRSPLHETFTKASEIVTGEGLLEEVDEVNYYHGTNAYYVTSGLDQDGDEAIVWLDEQLKPVEHSKRSEGISNEQALSLAKEEANIKRVQDVKLGFERGVPIYEIKFVDDADRQGYYYVTFADGTFVKRYNLQR